MKKSVDVIIPIYNIKKYLKFCVVSVIRQTYKNINIILVDDGSTDGSSELCDKLAKFDDRIIVYHKQNGGLFDARNYGLNNSKSDFIYFLDGDDYLPNNAISELVLNQLETNADVVFSGYRHIKKDGSKIFDIIPNKKIIKGEDKFSILFKTFLITSWGKLYTRELLNNVRFKNFRRAEDLYFYYDFATKAETISLLDKSLYYYVKRDDSITNSVNFADYFFDVDGYVYILTNLKKDKYSKALLNKFQVYLYNFYKFLYSKVKYEKNIYAATKQLKMYEKKIVKVFPFKYKIRVALKLFLFKQKIKEFFK